VKSIVDSMINSLGLKKVSHSKVGDLKTRGLSGGEKKRLCIGNEIVDKRAANSSSHSLLFADEPTSGLDCFQAGRVMSQLSSLARAGHTVVASIHQPRAAIYALFDDITLLSEGRLIFSGPVDELVPHFSSLGFACPDFINPAEFYVDLVSIDYTSPEDEAASRKRIGMLADSFASKVKAKVVVPVVAVSSNTVVTVNKQERGRPNLIAGLKGIGHGILRSIRKFRILHRRAWRQVTRDKSLNIARLASSLFSSLLFGAIYFRMSKSDATIPDRLGLLQVAAVNTAMTSLIKATTSFVTEKFIVQKERKKGAYSVLPYFLSKMAAEVPLSSLYPCLSAVIMYKLCGLNDEPGRLPTFMAILVVEAMASTALGMVRPFKFYLSFELKEIT
jgi:hypothetical protein